MDKATLAAELETWIGEDPNRETIMIKEAPIGESTLRATIRGRYIPAPRLEKAIRGVMQSHPTRSRRTAAVS